MLLFQEQKDQKPSRSPLCEKCAGRRRRYPFWRHRSDVTTMTGGLGSTFKVTIVKRGEICFCCMNLRTGKGKKVFWCGTPDVLWCAGCIPKCGAVISEIVHEWGRSVCVFILPVFVVILVVRMLSMIDYYCLSCVCHLARGAFFAPPKCRISPIDCFVCTFYTTDKVGHTNVTVCQWFFCWWSPM